MNPSDITNILLSIIVIYYNNYILLLITWIIYILIRQVWGGLSKLITILLFPGTLLYFTIRYLTAKILGLEIKPIMLIKATYETTGGLIRIKSPKDPVIMSLANIFTAIPLAVITFSTAPYFQNTIAKMVIIWLGASFFITGMPREIDIYNFLAAVWAIEPLGVLAIIVSIAVFATALEAYSTTTAIAATIIYLTLVTIILMTYKMPQKETNEEAIIIDEELSG